MTARNADVSNYMKMIDAVGQKGYKFLRIGDKSMTPIDSPYVVDLPHSDCTPGIDIYSVMRCNLLIGVSQAQAHGLATCCKNQH